MTDRPAPRRRRVRTALVTGLTLMAALMALPTGAAATAAASGRDRGPTPSADTDADEWQAVLRRAARAGQRGRYSGEVLWISWSGGQSHAELSQVHRSGTELTVSSPEGYTVRLRDDGGDLVDHEQGWVVPLPAAGKASTDLVAGLEDKYEVLVVGEGRLLDRPCTRLEVHRRSDSSLRERLWVDDATGLLLRRETFEGAEQRLRLVAYLSLDVRSGPATRAQRRPARTRAGDALQQRSHGASPVDEEGLEALRRAGWTVPAALPGGYEPVGAYAVDGAEAQPLHVVYGDGLYTVSLFQQRGTPDWTSLPSGATSAEGLDGRAYEWPGAVPRRQVWEAWGSTFSLVGDAPPEEFTAIAASLPAPERSGTADRLRRGLRRMWHGMSP